MVESNRHMTHIDFTNLFENWLSYNLKCIFQQNNLLNQCLDLTNFLKSYDIKRVHNFSRIALSIRLFQKNRQIKAIGTLNCNSTNFKKIREMEVVICTK